MSGFRLRAGTRVRPLVIQQKTGRPVQFELLEFRPRQHPGLA